MRLRLQVKRHELPVRNLLWHITDDTVTVSRLVEQINEIIPLESDQDGWGLEDYIVEVDGFECLHFGIVKDTFSDDDVVWIRPLEQTEVRQRRRSGSYQIAASGAHLIDGIAYGKTYMKRPARPDVNIPPRKKRRVENLRETGLAEDLENGEAASGSGVPNAGPDSNKPHANVNLEGNEAQDPTFNAESSFNIRNNRTSGHKKRKRVSFSLPIDGSYDAENHVHTSLVNGEEEDEDDDEDDDFAPDNDSDEQSASDTSESDAGEDSDAQMPILATPKSFRLRKSAPEVKVVNQKPESETSSSLTESSSEVSSDSVSDASDSSSEVSSESSSEESESESSSVESSDSDSSQERAKVKKVHTIQVPPGKGSVQTKSRNERRRCSSKLAKLKKQGLAPPNADHEFLRAHPRGIPSQNVNQRSKRTGEPSSTPSTIPEPDLSGKYHDVDETDERIFKSTPTKSLEDEAADDSASKRRRLDVASSRRLIFGGLGLRTPKTKVDEDALRDKFNAEAEKRKNGGKSDTAQDSSTQDVQKSAGNTELPEQDLGEADTFDDSWKSKISLTAVECHDQVDHLSTPPFPFEQRWDPQQQHQYRRENFSADGSLLSAKQKRKRKQRERAREKHREYEEENWYEAEMVEGDGLNYDEPAQPSEDSDLPTIPDDTSSLPTVTSEDLRSGAVIAFKQLELSEQTKWQPEISKFKTAIVINVDDSAMIDMRLALRDREHRERQYDEEGNRIFAKFEMPIDNEDEDEDDGYRRLSLEELIDPKLVQEAVTEGNNLAGVLTSVIEGKTEALVPDSPDIHATMEPQQEALLAGETDIVQDSIAPSNTVHQNNVAGEDSSEFSSLSSELSGSTSPIAGESRSLEGKAAAVHHVKEGNSLTLAHAGVYDSSSNELPAAQPPRETASNSTSESMQEPTSQNSDKAVGSKRVLRSTSRASQESIKQESSDPVTPNERQPKPA